MPLPEELLEAVKEADSDPEVRVVVITGAGKAFCSGGDVDEFIAGTGQALFRNSPGERYAMHDVVLTINKSDKPFIAAVNGVAAGGGCNLALSCDIRIASEKARFVQVFARRGAFPDWGAIHFLPRLVGYSKAAELLFTGEPVNSQESLKIGLVNKVVPHEQLMEETSQMAERIASNAPIPVNYIKRGLQDFYESDLDQALNYESMCMSICRNTDDFKEGFKAFLEKREAVFNGK